jgi:hypothetical protein
MEAAIEALARGAPGALEGRAGREWPKPRDHPRPG